MRRTQPPTKAPKIHPATVGQPCFASPPSSKWISRICYKSLAIAGAFRKIHLGRAARFSSFWTVVGLLGQQHSATAAKVSCTSWRGFSATQKLCSQKTLIRGFQKVKRCQKIYRKHTLLNAAKTPCLKHKSKGSCELAARFLYQQAFSFQIFNHEAHLYAVTVQGSKI